GGSHADPLGRRPPGRGRQDRAGDAPDAGAVLRAVRRHDAGQVRLAGAALTRREAIFAGAASATPTGRRPTHPASETENVSVATTPRSSPGTTRTSQP